MKNLLKSILISTCVVLVVVSCESDDVSNPDVQFFVDNDNPTVGESLTFSIEGGAETYAIYTGDEGREFQNSNLVVTEGQELDQELVFLSADSIPAITTFIQVRVDDYNAENNPDISADEIMNNISTLVGVEYTNKLTAAYEIYLFAPELEGFVARNLVDFFFTNESVLLAPPDGFSTGLPVDRYEKVLEYSYSTPGMYNATLVATNVGNSSNNYETSYTTKEIIITVDPE
jgi:hypothetical protein